ncbi:hypothetical protein BJX96DRAFT_121073 [Aspergillus floccosus]
MPGGKPCQLLVGWPHQSTLASPFSCSPVLSSLKLVVPSNLPFFSFPSPPLLFQPLLFPRFLPFLSLLPFVFLHSCSRTCLPNPCVFGPALQNSSFSFVEAFLFLPLVIYHRSASHRQRILSSSSSPSAVSTIST